MAEKEKMGRKSGNECHFWFGYEKASGGSGYAIKDANDTIGYGSGGRSGTGQYVLLLMIEYILKKEKKDKVLQ